MAFKDSILIDFHILIGFALFLRNFPIYKNAKEALEKSDRKVEQIYSLIERIVSSFYDAWIAWFYY